MSQSFARIASKCRIFMRNRCPPGMVSNDYSAGFRLIRCAVNSCFSSRNGAPVIALYIVVCDWIMGIEIPVKTK
ncbi:hypothetical protein ACN4GL_16695, partial [Burkholderia pseudomallei]